MTAPSARDLPHDPAPVASNGRDAVFTRKLHYELAGEESRPLVTCYGISFALGIAWLLFVYFGPRTNPMRLLSPDQQPIAVTFEAVETPPEPIPEGETGEEVSVPAPG